MSELPVHKKLAILMSFSGAGGVEKMLLNLLAEFVRQPALEIDLLLIRCQGPYQDRIPAGVRIIPLKAGHSLLAIPELVQYLRRSRPDALLAVKDRAGRAAVRARALSRVQVPIVVRLGTNLSASLAHRSSFSRWLRLTPLRRIYRRVDWVVGNSAGVAEDIRQLADLPAERVRVIYNPVVTRRLRQMADEPAPHDWLKAPDCPVILAMGRLTLQKDFATLIRAVRRVADRQPVRLIILGEGGERANLLQLINRLQLEEQVILPGHMDNPYAWISRANLFVLSSRWEGSPNALTEAFALGIPCVATDCPSGPAELLEGGRWGRLVPVGDEVQMALAIVAALANANDDRDRSQRLADFQAEASAGRYLELLFPGSAVSRSD